MNLNFFAINKAEKDFTSKYDGYVGIGPGGNKEHNLIDQLLDKGVIDHKVVAFYTDMKTQDSSIKFGSWDEEGLLKDASLSLVKTFGPDSWSVSLGGVTVVSQVMELSDPQTMALLEPAVPYIYVPESDFMKIQTLLQEAYPFQLTCSFERRVCFFA